MILLNEQLKGAVGKAVKKLSSEFKETIKVEYPAQAEYGDYSTNVAFELGKILGKNPKQTAEDLLKNMELPDWVYKTDIAGPGFINFFIAPKFASEFTGEILAAGDKFGSASSKEDSVVIDFSQPNIAKPLGIHHLLSTIIGQSLYNIHKFLGYKTIGVNHIGDWGTQFGKLTYAYKKWGDRKIVESAPIAELLKLYVKFHEEAEKDSSLEDLGREEFRKLEQGDAENKKLWEWFCNVSMEEIQRTYDFLGRIHFDYTQGESFYNDKMDEILERGKREGIFVKGEEGSWIARFAGDKYPPYLVQKSDGATLYSTRDIAAIKYREDTWYPSKILYVVDVAQELHFQQLFETARMMHLSDAEFVHVIFGRMQFKDKKMSTRKGNIVLLDEVLKEAVNRALLIVEEKNPDLAEKEKVAWAVGVGAVKYAVLSQNRTTNIVFDWNRMLSLDGNSAPYLQYVHARGKAILRKLKTKNLKLKTGKIILKEPQELAIARLLPKFPEVVQKSAEEYKPNLLANYLFELAGKFNSFYAALPVLQAESEETRNARITLVQAVCVVLKNGLGLLGIEATEEM